MKRIVIVEDRPWKMRSCIKELQSKGITFYKTIYYRNNSLDTKTQEELLNQYIEDTGMEIERVNSQEEFVSKMEDAYQVSDTIFLMDYDLKGDMNREDFFTRVNVRYALARDKERIWFYTTGPSDIKGILLDTFPDHVISVKVTDNMQGFWDEEQIRAAVQTG